LAAPTAEADDDAMALFTVPVELPAGVPYAGAALDADEAVLPNDEEA
jgi:hypothetical protein